MLSRFLCGQNEMQDELENDGRWESVVLLLLPDGKMQIILKPANDCFTATR